MAFATFQVDRQTLAAIDNAASAAGIGRSEWLRRAVREQLDRHRETRSSPPPEVMHASVAVGHVPHPLRPS